MCFAIVRLAIIGITYLCTVMQIIVSTKDDLRPHRPPPLPLLALCWRRRHCCHGCRVAAVIAAVTIAAATATAAAISAITSSVSVAIATTFWLIACLPLPGLYFGHHYLLLAANAIATVVVAANRCPLLLPPQLRDVQNISFKVIF